MRQDWSQQKLKESYVKTHHVQTNYDVDWDSRESCNKTTKNSKALSYANLVRKYGY